MLWDQGICATNPVCVYAKENENTEEELLAMEGKCVSQDEGIVDDCVDKSIHNLTSIGAEAMCKTDDMVLNIMTSKKH